MTDRVQEPMQIVGYSDRWTVRPGERVEFKVNTAEPSYDVSFVRLIQGDARPEGPGYREVSAGFAKPGRRPGRRQVIGTGSYVLLEAPPEVPPAGLTVTAWIQPTTATKPDQGIVSTLPHSHSERDPGGFALLLDGGRIRFVVRAPDATETTVVGPADLIDGNWYFVAGIVDPTGTLRVTHRLRDPWPIAGAQGAQASWFPGGPVGSGSSLVIGAAGSDRAGREPSGPGHFNGRIEGPTLYGRPITDAELDALAHDARIEGTLLSFDFGLWRPSTVATDIGPLQRHGRVMNSPGRAVRGHLWDGSEHVAAATPGHYAAIHFHDDDVSDAGWATDFTLDVPADARSGIYAAKLSAGSQPEREEYLPFVVTPRPNGPRAATLLVLPTLTYLAYGNEHFYNARFVDWAKASGRSVELSRQDRYVAIHPELGPSLYDLHSDGTISTYVSRLRPIVNFRPKIQAYWTGAGRHFNAELYLVDWLERNGFEHDVVTDEDLDRDADVLDGYLAVILGSHPEYVTGAMRDGLGRYLGKGGHLLYLGGNGLFWVSSLDPEQPHILEVRKSDLTAATPGLGVPPGEGYHSTTDEKGGTWKERGLPPESIVGVGYSGQGFASARPFVRGPEGHAPEFAWIFDGVDGDVIGDFGLALGGGAAGDEFDRADPAQGSPPHVRVLASSSGHDPFTLRFGLAYDFDESLESQTRADIAYLEYPNGGAVFAAGSMSWMPSLPHEGYQNSVSTITRNVLRRFLEPTT
jgi:N,N-dimethylformamidase